MENIRDILANAGVELEAEKLAEVERAVLANYRTKAELDGKSAKLAEVEKQLADANAAIETAKQTDTANAAEVEKMREQLAAYAKADEERKAATQKQAARAEFEERFAATVGDKAFANDIVKNAVTEKAFALSQSNPDMKLDDVLSAVVGDTAGVWSNPQQDVKKMPAGSKSAAGTQSVQTMADLENMSVEEIRAHMAEVDKVLAAQ